MTLELDFFKDLVTIYGPLGLGWPLAYLQWKRNERLHDKILKLIAEDTKVKTNLIKQLSGYDV